MADGAGGGDAPIPDKTVLLYAFGPDSSECGYCDKKSGKEGRRTLRSFVAESMTCSDYQSMCQQRVHVFAHCNNPAVFQMPSTEAGAALARICTFQTTSVLVAPILRYVSTSTDSVCRNLSARFSRGRQDGPLDISHTCAAQTRRFRDALLVQEGRRRTSDQNLLPHTPVLPLQPMSPLHVAWQRETSIRKHQQHLSANPLWPKL